MKHPGRPGGKSRQQFGVGALPLMMLCGMFWAVAVAASPSALAQEGCPDPPPNVEATPAPRAWTPGSGIGIVLDADGNPAEDENHHPIVDGRMTAPQDQTRTPSVPVQVTVAPGRTLPCAVESATDQDHWTQAGNDGQDCPPGASGDAGDEVSYHWTASGGSFEDAGSQTTTWTAPTAPGRYTITCTINDTPTAVTAPETGNRDDAPLPRSCDVVVYDATIHFLHSKVAAGAKDNDAHHAPFEVRVVDDHSQPVPNAVVDTPEVSAGGQGPIDGVITASVMMTGHITGSDGTVQGTLTSGNRTEQTTIQLRTTPGEPHSGGPTGSVQQVWNELPSDEEWTYDAYFDFDEPSTITYNMAYDRDGNQVAITGHDLGFVTTGIEGYEWNPDIGEDWDGDGVPDGDYEEQNYSHTDADTTEFDRWSGLIEWGEISENGGGYDAQQTIHWSDDFITDYVAFEVIDHDAYDEHGADDQ